ncbi:hypothetical protein PRUPE_3G117300 [Prunus persica]|uniref:Uncharacterized protein n=1 Tax=Prunus persica TaxID=3760 RepID=A0A251Q213_PRUPE|nr:hypothetical protein PRUPE_3G117300 [Prunus persica]
MARKFVVVAGVRAEEVGFMPYNSGGLLLLCMIFVSLSLISMVIFACSGKGSKKKKRRADCGNLDFTGCCCGDEGGPCGGGGRDGSGGRDGGGGGDGGKGGGCGGGGGG